MALLALAGGCARYEYDLVRPPELAQHVGTKAWSTVPLDDLEYRLLTSDNRLVMLIYNWGERTVKLSEADSVVVDPRGESRPLVGRTIDTGGDRSAGTLIGAVAGGLAGREIERSSSRRRCR